MTPYLAYWIPEHLGGSGVLATVAAGLYVSWNGPRLISSATRLQGIFFWDLIVYLIEGFLFLLTGLQARTLIDKAHEFPIGELLLVIAITTAIAIVARFVWVFPAAYLPRWASASLRKRDPTPPWQQIFVLAFTGVRGVVSLAAALAIPLTIASGNPFPQRDLILFATFGVIIITLIGQGLLLPIVIRWLGLADGVEAERRREQEAELAARLDAIEASRQQIDRLATERNLDSTVVEYLNERQDHRRRQIPDDLDQGLARAHVNNDLRLELIAAEREFLYELLRQGRITDESRRRLERDLDLEEAAIHARRAADTPL
jgi:CPA1 family monovalent cation:H+ antiporter